MEDEDCKNYELIKRTYFDMEDKTTAKIEYGFRTSPEAKTKYVGTLGTLIKSLNAEVGKVDPAKFRNYAGNDISYHMNAVGIELTVESGLDEFEMGIVFDRIFHKARKKARSTGPVIYK